MNRPSFINLAVALVTRIKENFIVIAPVASNSKTLLRVT